VFSSFNVLSNEVLVDFPFLCFLFLMSSVKMSADLNAKIKSSNSCPSSAAAGAAVARW